MGQQQLLLIALSVIIVGAAVAVGVSMFSEGSENAEIDLIYQQAPYIASKATEAWRKPSSMGGLNYSFTNLPEDLSQACNRLGIADTMGQLVVNSLTYDTDSTLTVNLITMGSGKTGIFAVGPDGSIDWTTRPGE
jgi:hypothetical protein